MKVYNSIHSKILTLPELNRKVMQWRIVNKAIVFTNGCFDILHPGHIASLIEAANQGDYLVVGVNSDSSIKKIKGENRPVTDEASRALLLASLSMVDAVFIFSEDTPLEIIKTIKPDILVKGGDYKVEEVVGSKEVLAAGGRVFINPIVEGFSSSSIIKKAGNSGSLNQ